MKQVFLDIKTGGIELIDIPKPILKQNYAIVETIFSAVSPGTERMLIGFGSKNIFQKIKDRPDDAKKIIQKIKSDGAINTISGAFDRLSEYIPLGYSAVGKILEIDSSNSKLRKGDLVAIAGTAYHSEINRVGLNHVIKVPSGITDLKEASLGAIGAICINAIHQIKLSPGDTVAVIGMGLIGKLVSKILNAYGSNVFGFDKFDDKNNLLEVGNYFKIDDKDLKDKVNSLTNSNGVDKIIITASSTTNAPLDLAMEIAAQGALITMVGVTRMSIDRKQFYEKELTFNIARSYGPGRYDDNYEKLGIDYPKQYVKNTSGRNIEEFLRLLSEKRIDVKNLIDRTFSIDDAQSAYNEISNKGLSNAILSYKNSTEKFKDNIFYGKNKQYKKADTDNIIVGIIGAGLFTRTVIMKYLSDNNNYHIRGVANTGGISSAQILRRFKVDYLTNNYSDLINDPKINLIIVSTEHSSHSKFVIEALKMNKNVYCEKPLAINQSQLQKIKVEYRKSKGLLFVGFNRRHAPFTKKMHETREKIHTPIFYEYLVSTNVTDNKHWANDNLISGGKIIGEAIHFVDLIRYIDGSNIKNLTVSKNLHDGYENAIISIELDSGSVGVITYKNVGSKKLLKEEFRMSYGSKTLINYNFLKLKNKIRYPKISIRQDKGFFNQYNYFYFSINNNKDDANDIFSIHEKLLKAIHNE